jgi:hypothetical protein
MMNPWSVPIQCSNMIKSSLVHGVWWTLEVFQYSAVLEHFKGSSYTMDKTWFNHITTLYWNTSRVHHTPWTRLDLIILLPWSVPIQCSNMIKSSLVHGVWWTLEVFQYSVVIWLIQVLSMVYDEPTLQGFIIHHGQDLI